MNLFLCDPYSLTQITTSTATYELAYDTASNRLSKTKKGAGVTQSIQYDLRSKPVQLSAGGLEETIRTGIQGHPYYRVDAYGRKTFYLSGGAEYRLSGPIQSNAQMIVRIHAHGFSPVAQVDVSTSTPRYTYFLRDHLGSPIKQIAGTPSTERYDTWGQPTAGSGTRQDMNDEYPGFTGHENIKSLDMIHMGARVYDPHLSCFLSPDKYIQGRSVVSVNRFAYVHNNPLGATDPSGWARVVFHPDGDFITHGLHTPDSRFQRSTPSPQRISPQRNSQPNPVGNVRYTRGNNSTIPSVILPHISYSSNILPSPSEIPVGLFHNYKRGDITVETPKSIPLSLASSISTEMSSVDSAKSPPMVGVTFRSDDSIYTLITDESSPSYQSHVAQTSGHAPRQPPPISTYFDLEQGTNPTTALAPNTEQPTNPIAVGKPKAAPQNK